MKKKSGVEKYVLLLSHQGYSFLEDLVNAVKKLGYRPFIISSKPSRENQHRIPIVSSLAEKVIWTEEPELRWGDVLGALRLHQFAGCISVWEGYRQFMARANGVIGANDISPSSVTSVVDKYLLRKTLFESGLSSADTTLLDESSFQEIKMSRTRKFIKPRTGLASFGTFALQSSTEFSEILALKAEMAMDREYRGIFGERFDFVAEDLIEGVEVSFEIIAVEGMLNTIGIHEKVGVVEVGHSVLETSCVSPPVSVDESDLDTGIAFIKKCFKLLGLNTGCYHVEAKFNAILATWEIIEINPRVGGALIKESVALQTGGCSIIELWLRSVVLSGDVAKQTILKELSLVRCHRRTFFRVYFGESNRTIKSIRKAVGSMEPTIFRISALEGSTTSSSSREIFLGQALWDIGPLNIPVNKSEILKLSHNSLEVAYA